MSISNKKEPKAIHNNNMETWQLVIDDYVSQESSDRWYPENKKDIIKEGLINLMRDRNQYGINKHGTPLQPFNGRNNLNDCLQELMDATAYIKNEQLEDNNVLVDELYSTILSTLEAVYLYISIKG